MFSPCGLDVRCVGAATQMSYVSTGPPVATKSLVLLHHKVPFLAVGMGGGSLRMCFTTIGALPTNVLLLSSRVGLMSDLQVFIEHEACQGRKVRVFAPEPVLDKAISILDVDVIRGVKDYVEFLQVDTAVPTSVHPSYYIMVAPAAASGGSGGGVSEYNAVVVQMEERRPLLAILEAPHDLTRTSAMDQSSSAATAAAISNGSALNEYHVMLRNTPCVVSNMWKGFSPMAVRQVLGTAHSKRYDLQRIHVYGYGSRFPPEWQPQDDLVSIEEGDNIILPSVANDGATPGIEGASAALDHHPSSSGGGFGDSAWTTLEDRGYCVIKSENRRSYYYEEEAQRREMMRGAPNNGGERGGGPIDSNAMMMDHSLSGNEGRRYAHHKNDDEEAMMKNTAATTTHQQHPTRTYAHHEGAAAAVSGGWNNSTQIDNHNAMQEGVGEFERMWADRGRRGRSPHNHMMSSSRQTSTSPPHHHYYGSSTDHHSAAAATTAKSATHRRRYHSSSPSPPGGRRGTLSSSSSVDDYDDGSSSLYKGEEEEAGRRYHREQQRGGSEGVPQQQRQRKKFPPPPTTGSSSSRKKDPHFDVMGKHPSYAPQGYLFKNHTAPPRKLYVYDNENKDHEAVIVMLPHTMNLVALRAKIGNTFNIKPMGNLFTVDGGQVRSAEELLHGQEVVATKLGGAPFYLRSLPRKMKHKKPIDQTMDAEVFY